MSGRQVDQSRRWYGLDLSRRVDELMENSSMKSKEGNSEEERKILENESIRFGGRPGSTDVYMKLPSFETNVWNYYEPPLKMRFINKNEALYSENRETVYHAKPGIVTQKMFISRYRWPNFGKFSNDGLGKTRRNPKLESISNIRKVNLFDKAFSPSTVFPCVKKLENVRDIYDAFDEVSYLPAERLAKLEHKCKEVDNDLVESKKRALQELEKIFDSQIETFRSQIRDKISLRRKIMEEMEHQSRIELNEEYISLSKNQTPFTKLILKCSDCFEIIFSYFYTKDILCTFSLISRFFRDYVKLKVPLSILVSTKQLERIPLEYVLNGYRVKNLQVGFPFPFDKTMTIVLNVATERKRLQRVIQLNKDSLRKIKILELEHVQMGRVRGIRRLTELEHNSDKSITNEAQKNEKERCIRNARDIFDQINQCKILEVLHTRILPSCMSDLSNLTEIHYPVSYRYLHYDRLEKKMSRKSRSGRIRNPLITKTYENLFFGNFRILKDLRVLKETFEKKNLPHLKSLSLIDPMTTRIPETKEPYMFDTLLSPQTVDLFTSLYDAIAHSDCRLERFRTRLMYGFETFSEMFMEYLSLKVKNVRLVYFGELIENGEERRRGNDVDGFFDNTNFDLFGDGRGGGGYYDVGNWVFGGKTEESESESDDDQKKQKKYNYFRKRAAAALLGRENRYRGGELGVYNSATMMGSSNAVPGGGGASGLVLFMMSEEEFEEIKNQEKEDEIEKLRVLKKQRLLAKEKKKDINKDEEEEEEEYEEDNFTELKEEQEQEEKKEKFDIKKELQKSLQRTLFFAKTMSGRDTSKFFSSNNKKDSMKVLNEVMIMDKRDLNWVTGSELELQRNGGGGGGGLAVGDDDDNINRPKRDKFRSTEFMDEVKKVVPGIVYSVRFGVDSFTTFPPIDGEDLWGGRGGGGGRPDDEDEDDEGGPPVRQSTTLLDHLRVLQKESFLCKGLRYKMSFANNRHCDPYSSGGRNSDSSNGLFCGGGGGGGGGTDININPLLNTNFGSATIEYFNSGYLTVKKKELRVQSTFNDIFDNLLLRRGHLKILKFFVFYESRGNMRAFERLAFSPLNQIHNINPTVRRRRGGRGRIDDNYLEEDDQQLLEEEEEEKSGDEELDILLSKDENKTNERRQKIISIFQREEYLKKEFVCFPVLLFDKLLEHRAISSGGVDKLVLDLGFRSRCRIQIDDVRTLVNDHIFRFMKHFAPASTKKKKKNEEEESEGEEDDDEETTTKQEKNDSYRFKKVFKIAVTVNDLNVDIISRERRRREEEGKEGKEEICGISINRMKDEDIEKKVGELLEEMSDFVTKFWRGGDRHSYRVLWFILDIRYRLSGSSDFVRKVISHKFDR